MNPTPEFLTRLSRRHFLGASALGLGAFALDSIAEAAGQTPPRGLQHRAKAKRVIYLFQAGGPSQFETLDPKPLLREKRASA